MTTVVARTPFAHQVALAELALPHLAEVGGFGLFMQQRTGKTGTAIEVARRVAPRGRTLVLTPSQAGNVPRVWVSELAAAWPDSPPVTNLTGTRTERAETLRRLADRPGVFVCNYDLALMPPLGPKYGARGRQEHNGLLASLDFDLLVLDESHRTKNPTSQWGRAAVALADRIPNRLALTGTPTHTPLDIWNQYRSIDRGLTFGRSYVDWRNGHMRPATKSEYRDADIVWLTQRKGVKPDAFKLIGLEDIQQKMLTHAVRVDRTDVFPDMPPELPDDLRYVELEPSARKLYRDMEKDAVAELDAGIVSASNGGVKVLRLHQLTGGTLQPRDLYNQPAGPAQQVSDAKEKLLAELLEDSDDPVVVFGVFHTDLDAIARAAAKVGATCGELSGRRNDLEAWQAGETRVLAAQVQAGGVGIDLSRSSCIIFYAMGDSLIDHDQARARIVGPKQTEPASFIYLLVRNSIDEDIYAGMQAGGNIADFVLSRVRARV